MKRIAKISPKQRRLICTEKWGIFYCFSKIDKSKRKLARFLNRWIQLLWIPCPIIGIFSILYRIITGPPLNWNLFSLLAGFALAPCSTALLHELGHAAAALAYGAHVTGIGFTWRIYLFGYTVITVPANLPTNRRIQIDAAGIQMNFLAAGICFFLPSIPHFFSAFWIVMGLYNFLSGIFNLCPFKDLDGFHILSLCLGDENILPKARYIARTKGKASIIKGCGADGFLSIATSYLILGLQLFRFVLPILGVWMILEQF